jgi:integrase
LEELWKLKLTGHEYVFPFRHTRSVRTEFEKAREKASLTDLRFHDMRHTFAARLVERGVDIITVQELLGHHSVVVTQRYTHSNAEQKRRAVGILTENCPQIVHKNRGEQAVPVVSNSFSIN